ncbi:zinc-binding alcohol dehydrogenase family protein [Kitasatospora purpeofusca]|uniref:quinone oxidoreductase family protein n=1 Tax=Kitasatospora purpeofusca TaxID=67352 RepID=UPI0036D22F08
MRAVGFTSPGGPEALRVLEMPVPVPAPGQVLVEVAYAGVNFAEVYRRRGWARATGEPVVPGLEVSGRVAGWGEGVDGLSLGDPVAALTHEQVGASGGYAQFAVAPQELVYPLRTPAGEVDLLPAAALPCTVTTAYGLLRTGRFAAGEDVLIHAALGGVGSTTARVARLLGARRVLGTVGTAAKLDRAEAALYDALYLREDTAGWARPDGPDGGFDLVLDSVAGPTTQASLGALRALGRVVVYGNPGGHPDTRLSAQELWLSSRAVIGYNLGEIAVRAPHVLREQALAAVDLMADRRLTVGIGGIMPLESAWEAHRLLESGASVGKLVLSMAN